MSNTCDLCSLPISSHNFHWNDLSFCCQGCLLVYQVLSEKSSLDNFENDPVFIAATKSGLISNPELIEKINTKNQVSDDQKIYFSIENMWCPSCAQLLTLILSRLKGVSKAYVDYTTDIGFVSYNPLIVSDEDIFNLIKKWEYSPNQLELNYNIPNRMKTFKAAVAGFSALNVMMFSLPVYTNMGLGQIHSWTFNMLSFVFSLPLLAIWYPYLKRSFKALVYGVISMESLVSISALAALSLSCINLFLFKNHVYFDSMSMLLSLVTIGKLIESRAKYKACTSWRTLIQLQPQKVRVQVGDSFQYIPLKECKQSDLVVVNIGERIPLDGVVVKGSGSIDQSLLTGESFPISVKAGESISAGGIVIQGCITLQLLTDKPSQLEKMISIIEKQFENKSKVRPKLDIIMQYFIPGILLLTGVVVLYGIYFEWETLEIYERALSMLMISCPCSIGLAAPLVTSFFIHDNSRNGVIIRDPAIVEKLSNETDFVFDKTGTITKGEFTLSKIEGELTSIHKEILYKMTSLSRHPVAKAVHKYYSIYDKQGLLDNFEVQEIIGLGIKLILSDSNTEYFLGSYKFLNSINKTLVHKKNKLTDIFFFSPYELLARLSLKDSIRDSASGFLDECRSSGMIHLISGDHADAVRNIAQTLNFNIWKAEQSPIDKQMYISNLKKEGRSVLFVGDGINDALPIIESNIGIAISEGADVSMQVADVVITDSFFSKISTLRNKARNCKKIIQQNLTWSFGYNGLGMILAMNGLLKPIHAVLIMAVSSLFVTLNAVRVTKKN